MKMDHHDFRTAGVVAPSETHERIMSVVKSIPAPELQTIMFQSIEDCPESLIEPIEAELRARGFDPYGLIA